MTARDELRALAEVARQNAASAREMANDFQNRADALDVIVIHHTDQVCQRLIERIKGECAKVLPS